MVNVPQSNGPSVVPNVSRGTNNVQASLENFGGGAGVNESNNLFQKILEQENNRAFNNRMLEASRALDDFELQTIYDSKNGLLSRKGKDALGTPDEYRKSFDAFAKSQLAAASGFDQREGISKMLQARDAHISKNLAIHVGKQMDVYHSTELAAANESSKTIATLDPSRVPDRLEVIRANAAELARHNGLGPEAAAVYVNGEVEGLHARVLKAMIDNKQTSQAGAYLATYGSQMPNSAAKFRGILESADVDDRAQSAVDEISSFMPLTTADGYSQALKAVDGIKDEKVRSAAHSKLKQAKLDQEGLLADRRDETYQDLIRSVEATPGRPLSESLTVSQMDALKALPVHLRDAVKLRARKPEDIAMDDDARIDYYKFQDLDDSAIAKIDPVTFHARVSRYDKETRGRAESRWVAARKGGDESAFNNRLKDLKSKKLKMSEIVPLETNKWEVEDYQQAERFDRRVDEAIRVYRSKNNGKPPGGDDLEILLQESMRETLPWRGNNIPISALTNSEIEGLTGRLSPSDFNSAIKEVPASSAERIAGEISAAKRKVTPERIVRIWRAIQIGDEDLANRILVEKDD